MIKNGIEYDAVNYLKDGPLTASKLKTLLQMAGLKPQEAIRTKEQAYKQLVADQDLSDEQLIEVMAAHPELIQRPIVVRGKRAVLARPVQKLADLGIK